MPVYKIDEGGWRLLVGAKLNGGADLGRTIYLIIRPDKFYSALIVPFFGTRSCGVADGGWSPSAS